MIASNLLEALYSRTTKGVKLDLERMRVMCAAAGNPQLCAPSVLIAGTNGKGSVSAMWAAAAQARGHKTGLYTSPHLIQFSERVRINGAEADLAPAYATLIALEQQTGVQLTFFEAATFMAFVTFRMHAVE